MHREAYAEFAAEDQTQARRAEYDALDLVIQRLSAARESGCQGATLDRALNSVEALWSIFVKDVSCPENGLPKELRRNIVTIGRWIFARTTALRNADVSDLDALIDVNISIRDGLKARP